MKKSDKWKLSMDSHRENATHIIAKLFFYVFTFSVLTVHYFQYRSGLPVIRDLIVYGLLSSGLYISSIIIHKNSKAGIHLFTLLILLILIYIDFFSIRDFSLDIMAPLLYLLPVSICIFFLNPPVSVIFSALFVLIFWLRLILLSEQKGLENFITFIMTILSVMTMLTVKIWLSRLFVHKIENLTRLNEVTTEILGKVVELRDGETSNHLCRVRLLTGILLHYLKIQKKYRGYLSNTYIKDMKLASTLHDIGKIGISDTILLKPGKLTDQEYEKMKEHSIIGYKLLKEAKSKVEDQSFYDLAIEMIRHHHERWDGTGYPDSLKGEEIPLSARIMAIADVYDALTSERSYKKAFSHSMAVSIISDARGTIFDPEITDIFIEHNKEIEEKIKNL
jgi:HD-GYP domain-containing protein (c-di-GMP phosphodiesterase class II)